MKKKNLRVWWQKPKRYADQEEERKVSFLELFYDLIYVAIISQLSHRLAVDITLESFLQFVFLFLAIWWGWFNGAMYHDLHGNHDIKTRIITFIQMFAVASMAVFIHNAFSDGAVGFIISYSIFLSIIALLWYRTGYHDPEHKPISNPFSFSYFISIIIMIISIFEEAPFRFYLWYISLAILILQPILIFSSGRKKPKMKAQIDKSIGLSPSIIERFGLLTIIVLGEVVVGVVNGLTSNHHLEWENGFIAFLAMSMAVGIWWIYFDFISNQKPKKERLVQNIWGYIHLPLTLGITAIGAATLNIVSDGNDSVQNVRLLLTSGITLVYLCISILFFTLENNESTIESNRIGQIVTALTAISSIVLYFSNMQTHTLLFCLDLTMLAPIYFGFRVWIKQYLRRNKLN